MRLRHAVNSMEDNKALGPDGFPSLFLKVCWDVVEQEVMSVLKEFHNKDQWSRSLSATFITFNPKKKGAIQIKDYQPISLVGCMYKLLARLLLFCSSLSSPTSFWSRRMFSSLGDRLLITHCWLMSVLM